MENCERCKAKIADFKCENCIRFFCANCDSFVHSLPSKIGHKRIFINTSFIQNKNLNSNNSSNLPNNNIINNNNLNTYNNSQNNINEKVILKLSEREKEDLRKKIKKLTEELNNTKRILYGNINENINNIKENNLEDNSTEKDTQIENLIKELNNQKEINLKLNKKIKEYDNYIELLNQEHKIEINNLNNELENITNQKNSIDNFYKVKIEELHNLYQTEREKIILNYEMQITKLNDGYSENKKKYMKLMKERENYFKELEKNSKKEKNELNSIIDKLKDFNSISGKDQNDLMKMNENLKKALEEVNNELEITKENLKNTNKENKKLLKKNNKILEENEEIKKANNHLHGVVYGRFRK